MMLSARLWQLCGVGWKARLLSLLLCLYLQTTASDHFFSVTLCAAVFTSPSGSAGGKETNRTQQGGESTGRRHSIECLAGRAQDCATGAPHGLREPHRPSGLLGATRRRHACESPVDAPSARVGSILFVFASLLVGHCIQRRVPFSYRGSALTELRHHSDLFFAQARTREAALVFASLRDAVRHFQKVTETQQTGANTAPGGSTSVSRRASFGGSWDTHSRQGAYIPGRLHRSASTDKLDLEAVSLLPLKVGRHKKRDCTTTQSFITTPQTPKRLALYRGSQWLSQNTFEMPEELTVRTDTTSRTFDLSKLKSVLSFKLQRPKFSPVVGNVRETTGWARHGDGNRDAWCGVVAAVSKAISDAYTRSERYHASGDVREKVLIGEEAPELYSSRKFLLTSATAGNIRAVSSTSESPTSSTPPEDTDSEERTALRHGRELAARETESEGDGVEKPTVSGSERGKTCSPHPELLGQKKAASVPTLSKPKAQRHTPKKSASFPQEAKGAGAQSPGSSECRRSSYDRDSSAEAEQSQKQGRPSHTSLSRRWFVLSKAKRSPTTQETDRESEKSAEQRLPEVDQEGWRQKVESELGRKDSTLLQEAEHLWASIFSAKVEQLAGRVLLNLGKLDASTASLVGDKIRDVSSRTVGLHPGDTLQLLYSVADQMDLLWYVRRESADEMVSLAPKTYFRSWYSVACGDESLKSIYKDYSASILSQAATLEEAFCRFADDVTKKKPLSPVEMEIILDLAKKLNALFAIIGALDIKDGAAIRVRMAYVQLLKLADQLGHAEGACSVVAYIQSIGAFVDGNEVIAKVEEESNALEVEVYAALLEQFTSAASRRISQLLEPHKGTTSSRRWSSVLPEQPQSPAVSALLNSTVKELQLFFDDQIKASVHKSVSSDMEQVQLLLPEPPFPAVSHLLAILNDSRVRQEVIDYHAHRACELVVPLFYKALPVFVWQLGREYTWLVDWVACDAPGRFEAELEKLNARLHTLIVLTEELGLSNSVYAGKLKRTVRLSKQIEIERCYEPLKYIASVLTSTEREDGEKTLAGVRLARETAAGGSSVEAVFNSLVSDYSPDYDSSSL